MKKLHIYDGSFTQLVKLIKQLDPKQRNVTSREASLPLGYTSATPTPDTGGSGGGSAGAQTIYQWLAIPGSYIAGPSIVLGQSGDDVDMGVDIYQGVALDTSNPSTLQLYVNGNKINQGSSGGYTRWSVADSNSIILHNYNIAGPKGDFSGTVIIIRKVV